MNTANSIDPSDDPAHFVAKWRADWPEWAIAEVFLPTVMRARVDAWQALQFELLDAAWGGADPRPGEAKLGWWMDELHGWSLGRRRHPLGSALQRGSAGWGAMAATIPALQASRRRPADGGDAWSTLHPVAAAAAVIEGDLFAMPSGPADLTAGWLHARLARHPDSAVPQALIDADGPEASTFAWMRALCEYWPRTTGAGRYRRLANSLARARLMRGEAARPLHAGTTLLTCWRAARD
ncbi:MAG: phytoene/squalene synthase family protein [Lysobacter sp.]|nr:MAG: phytoene/squalene synthase family protein [Lysobacter sp.]